MSVPQTGLKPPELKPTEVKPTEVKPTESGRPPRSPRPMPCLKDWDFWRFLISALGLLWDILKTTFLK